jgi:hypothetical protein
MHLLFFDLFEALHLALTPNIRLDALPIYSLQRIFGLKQSG